MDLVLTTNPHCGLQWKYACSSSKQWGFGLSFSRFCEITGSARDLYLFTVVSSMTSTDDKLQLHNPFTSIFVYPTSLLHHMWHRWFCFQDTSLTTPQLSVCLSPSLTLVLSLSHLAYLWYTWFSKEVNITSLLSYWNNYSSNLLSETQTYLCRSGKYTEQQTQRFIKTADC